MEIINLKSIIRQALSELNIPIIPVYYEGTSRKYITFNLINDSEQEFADDEAISSEQLTNIHLYYDEDYTSVLNIIKTKLKEVGFSDIQVIFETFENDTKLYHLTLSAKFEY